MIPYCDFQGAFVYNISRDVVYKLFVKLWIQRSFHNSCFLFTGHRVIRHEESRNEISQKVEIFTDIILFKTEGWIGRNETDQKRNIVFSEKIVLFN